MNNRKECTAIGVLLAFSFPGQLGFARKPAHRSTVEVDGQSYKVIRYDDETVKVVDGGVFGRGEGMTLRRDMREAVIKATGCAITDDFFVDGKLNGTLACASPQPQGG